MTAIAVLGAGNIGATLARKWTAAGHQVTLGSRNPDALPGAMSPPEQAQRGRPGSTDSQ